MPTTTPLTDAINALTTYSNTVTGASDTTLSDAVATLASGYGGGGGNAVSGSFTLSADYALPNSATAFTSVVLPFKPDFFWMALDRESYDASTPSTNRLRMLLIIDKDMALPMRIANNVSTDTITVDTYPMLQINLYESSGVENGYAGGGFALYGDTYSSRWYFDANGQLYVGKYSTATSYIAQGTWHYCAMKA